MVIILRNKYKDKFYFHSAQFRYAAIYTVITFVVLLFLNIYSSKVSQKLFYNSKETSMIGKCKLAAVEIAGLEALNANTVSSAISSFEDLNVSRVLITDQNSRAIYDSQSSATVMDQYVLFPEIITALDGNDVFYWYYRDGMMRSTAATPVYSYGTLIGCVYMMEYDAAQGTLFATLQNNIFTITLSLEIVVILYSLIFSNTYTRKLKRIVGSIRTVRQGDYSHKLTMRGNDELNVLGNEFNDLIARLQESEMKRSRFVSDASHELKTPLASIKLLSDSILQNEMDINTIKEFVSDIGNEAERLNIMSQKLLTLSRIDGQEDENFEITYIKPTVERVVRMLHHIADKSDITIITNCATDFPIRISEDDLYQIIFNLIENGIKYNTNGGQLKISVFKQSEYAVIQVSDTGVGIPDESVPHIFERFYRVDKARSRSTGGSGLGLSIVRSIVERNHGTIDVISRINKGTEFTLRIPLYTKEDDL